MIQKFDTNRQAPVAGGGTVTKILLLATVIGAIWYFGFHLPKKKKAALALAEQQH